VAQPCLPQAGNRAYAPLTLVSQLVGTLLAAPQLAKTHTLPRTAVASVAQACPPEASPFTRAVILSAAKDLSSPSTTTHHRAMQPKSRRTNPIHRFPGPVNCATAQFILKIRLWRIRRATQPNT
jgi:hypothetical protein